MATIHRDGTSDADPVRVAAALAQFGVDVEQWAVDRPLGPNATDAEVLEAYGSEVDRLKASGGYVVADVAALSPETVGLDELLAKFAREHTHADDEVRFVVSGRGLFFLVGDDDDVLGVEVAAGDLLRVPAGLRHWFTLCGDRHIRTIRLFRDPAGWVPSYTERGTETSHVPMCLGETHLPRGTATR